MTALAEKRQREIDEMARACFRGLPTTTENAPAAGFSELSRAIFSATMNYGLDGEEIKRLLETSIRMYGERVASAAIETGKIEERKTNPALRSFGACVEKAYVDGSRRDRALACEVFEELVQAGNNPSYSFYQAIDSIGGKAR